MRSRKPHPMPKPAPSRAPHAHFRTLVREAPASPVVLPLTHVTDAWAFRDIMDGGSLAPTACPVFGGELLYLFYGKPAYRSAAERENKGSDVFWPICFVLEPGAVTEPARIYPFDSGAFHHRLFDRHLHPRMLKEDFELDADPATPGRLIRLFWQDERCYFEGEGAAAPDLDVLAFEAKAYRALIDDVGSGPFDDRNSAIEIQTGAPIALQDNIIAVILPGQFLNEPLAARIEAMGALALPINPVRRQAANEMVSEIYRTVRDLLGGKHGRGPWW